ncbi:outer membrane beta-barrel protein [Flammeovirga sp. SJP92]|uniref:outer membrane beta-barrel protein n=1 Tax=Flammeovirga sp. SJP92 TaxID=1775430 RepID=UPI00079B2ED8|nr:outer membrane beta-barrel protein [Flammeovirga sp. SJP92]KXX68975.1 hypothetical protein AVL50_17595 [Flammeovirga sp. SJP92]
MNFSISFKRTLYILLLSLTCSSLNAQDFYVGLGTNVAGLDYSPENTPYNVVDNTYQLGFQIGATMELKINGNISFFPQMYFTQKRKKVSQLINIDQQIIMHTMSKGNAFTMDVPLNMKFDFNLGNTKLFALIGPFMNFYLFDLGELYIDGIKVDEEFQTTYFSKVDYGINLGMGVHLQRYLVMLTYDYAMDRTVKMNDPFSGEEFEFERDGGNAIKLTVAYKLKN